MKTIISHIRSVKMPQFSKTYTFLSAKPLFHVCLCVCTVCALSSVFYTTFLPPHIVLRLLSPCISHFSMKVFNLFGKSWNHYWSWNSGRMIKLTYLLNHCACISPSIPYTPSQALAPQWTRTEDTDRPAVSGRPRVKIWG